MPDNHSGTSTLLFINALVQVTNLNRLFSLFSETKSVWCSAAKLRWLSAKSVEEKMSQKRLLPSWMNSTDPRQISSSRNATSNDSKPVSTSSTTQFSKLMDGVSFVLSGFVNPERSTLRSQALAMGATYQSDWNSHSTLLISAFPNTPKFRQVQTHSGTIVSKDWITECYMQKKLVDIEQYLMHPGKPWRQNTAPQEAIQEKRSEKQVDKKPEPRGTPPSKNVSPVKEAVSVTEVKKWARDDLTQTISWLKSQEEKPEADELKRVAVQGVLTCLEDAIESLERKQDIGSVTEQWSFVPRVVKELGKMESSSSKEELCKQAKSWRKMYKAELGEAESSGAKSKGNTRVVETEYDSDETVEMTEEEIEQAYMSVSLH